MKKMIRLKIKDKGNQRWMEESTYSNDSFEFAGVNAPDKNKVITLEYDPQDCREALCSDFRDSERCGSYPEIAKDRCRLVLYSRGPLKSTEDGRKQFYEKTKRRAECGIKILNAFELEVGWPLTRMYKLKTDMSERNVFFYVVGNHRWVKAPQLLSLFTLLLRLGHSEVDGFKGYKALVKAILSSKKGNSTDRHFFKTYHTRWLLILKNYDRLFGTRSDFYEPSHSYSDSYFHDGINSLCDVATEDIKLARELEKILKEEK